MKAVIQRCTSACVTADGEVTGKIDKGFVVLLGVERDDEIPHANAVADKIYSMRIFCDENGKINLSLGDVGGSVLVISNFTLCADCSHGNRPYFGEAADPEKAEQLYNYFCDRLSQKINVQRGVFGADMKLELLNDGPVTIVLDSRDLKIKI